MEEELSDMKISNNSSSSPSFASSSVHSTKKRKKTNTLETKKKVLISESKKKIVEHDLVDYFQVLDENIQNRTVVIPNVPSSITPFFLKSRIEEEKCGVVEFIQIFKKKKRNKKPKKDKRGVRPSSPSSSSSSNNWIAFVRFIEEASIERMLHLYYKKVKQFFIFFYTFLNNLYPKKKKQKG